MLKRGLHRLVQVYTCQNATLLEITCHGSFVFVFAILSHQLLEALWSPVGNGLTSWLSWLSCHFPMRFHGSGVVLDCIDS